MESVFRRTRGGRRVQAPKRLRTAAAEAVDVDAERDAPRREPVGGDCVEPSSAAKNGARKSTTVVPQAASPPQSTASGSTGASAMISGIREREHGQQVVARRVGRGERRAELAVEAQRRVEERGRGVAVLGQQLELGRRSVASSVTSSPTSNGGCDHGATHRSLRGDRIVGDVRLAERQRVAAPPRRAAHHHQLGDVAREVGMLVAPTTPMFVSGPSVTSVNSPRPFAHEPREQRRTPASATGRDAAPPGPAALPESVVAVDERGRPQVGRGQQRPGRADGDRDVGAARGVRDPQHARGRDIDVDTLPHTTVIATTSSAGSVSAHHNATASSTPPSVSMIDRAAPRRAPQASRLVGRDDRAWHDHGKLIQRSVCAHTYSGVMIDQGLWYSTAVRASATCSEISLRTSSSVLPVSATSSAIEHAHAADVDQVERRRQHDRNVEALVDARVELDVHREAVLHRERVRERAGNGEAAPRDRRARCRAGTRRRRSRWRARASRRRSAPRSGSRARSTVRRHSSGSVRSVRSISATAQT